ncbi:MAG TPA: hypothetical protein VJS11_14360 [Acidobacteriaceae bacterium]|nr:hypothetical protein [Acidobacteriaceae bacterium]
MLTFCVICSITTPLILLIAIVATPSPLNIVVGGALGTYSCVIGISLWRMKPGALKNTKTFLTIIGLANIGSAIINGINSNLDGFATGLLGLLVAAAWRGYLDDSKRVKATFGDPDFHAQTDGTHEGDLQAAGSIEGTVAVGSAIKSQADIEEIHSGSAR